MGNIQTTGIKFLTLKMLRKKPNPPEDGGIKLYNIKGAWKYQTKAGNQFLVGRTKSKSLEKSGLQMFSFVDKVPPEEQLIISSENMTRIITTWNSGFLTGGEVIIPQNQTGLYVITTEFKFSSGGSKHLAVTVDGIPIFGQTFGPTSMMCSLSNLLMLNSGQTISTAVTYYGKDELQNCPYKFSLLKLATK